MVRIHLIVEGQTEETFVKKVLAPYMSLKNVFMDSRSVETGRKGAIKQRGGMTNYLKAKKDINSWLSEDKKAYVSTMFDLYRLPNDFPGMNSCPNKTSSREKVNCLETELAKDISNNRFKPYLQLHEFEALLFAKPNEIDALVPPHNNNQLNKLMKILSEFNNDPELIDEGPQTAPSKRILEIYPRYKKVAYGPRVIQKAGIDSLLENCKHFREWTEILLNLPELH